MNSNDQDRDYVENLAGIALNAVLKKGRPKESPGLDKRFRCPKDGSTNTQAIQEILDASITSMEINGKTVTAVVGSPLLKRYRIGTRPRVRYEFVPLSALFFLLIFVALGMWNGSTAVFQAIIALTSSIFTFMLFWGSKKSLPDEIKKWEERKFTAENKWHCHQCGKPFLPKPPMGEADPPESGESSLEPSEDSSPAAENVRPLVPNPSGTEDV